MQWPSLPQSLLPVVGAIPAEILEGAVSGLAEQAGPVRQLLADGFVPPDILTCMTLHLLTHQPRLPTAEAPSKGAIEGGVWVREQVTYHTPPHAEEVLTVAGQSAARFIRRGRRYGVTVSETSSLDGRLFASNCTTGLLSYQMNPQLEDEHTGLPESDLVIPGPDWTHAAENPCRARLAQVREGEIFTGPPVQISLEMMRLRNAGRNHNPIHTDAAVARREGLTAPIAGGSHVLAFLQAMLMEQWGPQCILHGAHFDVRWTAQTYADSHITSVVKVAGATRDELSCELEIMGEDRVVMRGTLRLPLAPPSPA